MRADQKIRFYNQLKANKAIVVPQEDLLQAACDLETPCFTIIEEPLQKRKRRKNNLIEKDKDKATEITSKIIRMNIMNLMWNINDSSIKMLNSKINRSPALNIKKFKGLANEKLNAVTGSKNQKKNDDKIEVFQDSSSNIPPIAEHS